MRNPTDRELAGLIEELHERAELLARGIPIPPKRKTRTPNLAELVRRAHTAIRDGYPSRSLAPAGGKNSISDPVGEHVVSDATDDPIWRHSNEATGYLTDAVLALRAACTHLEKAFATQPAARAVDPDQCRNHADAGHWEPVHRQDRCRWCYEWWLANGKDAPSELLEARAQGRRITTKLVEAALRKPVKVKRRKKVA